MKIDEVIMKKNGPNLKSWIMTLVLMRLSGLLLIAVQLAAGTTNAQSPLSPEKGDGIGKSSVTAPSTLTPLEAATLVRQPPDVVELALSPNGTALVYSVHRRAFKEERHITDLFLQKLDATGVAVGAPTLLEHAESERLAIQFRVRWSPKGDAFAYYPPVKDPKSFVPSTELVRYDLSSATRSTIPVRDAAPYSNTSTQTAGRRRITRIPGNYRWSPSGRYLAFVDTLYSVTERPKAGAAIRLTPQMIDSGMLDGARLDYLDLVTNSTTSGLFVLDVQTGSVDLISPESRSMAAAFDWSPDEKQIATFSPSPTGSLELIVIDRATREVRTITKDSEGLLLTSTALSWSPDGKWLAFFVDSSTVEGAWTVVSSNGGTPVRLQGPNDPQARTSGISWAPDSNSFYYYPGQYRWSHAVTRVDIQTRRVEIVHYDAKLTDSPNSFSAGNKWRAFVRSSYVDPDEVFVQQWPSGEPRQLTRLSPEFPLRSRVRVEPVNWPSSDGKFTIHGYLLMPAANTNVKPSGPLPTVVWIKGGPSMGINAYEGRAAGHGEMLALAARGYVVFIPNTRGRGGQDEAFRRGIFDGSFARLPYEDVMAGVDSLIQRGVTDPRRLGVMGLSYGAFLTSYIPTQTDRFKAAVVYEGAIFDWVKSTFSLLPSKRGKELLYHRGVRGNPFEPTQMRASLEQSPAFNMRCVATPTLLLAGHNAQSMLQYFSGLTWFGVPVEFIGYQGEAHGNQYIQAEIDYVARMGTWFDYWLRDMPYTEPSLQKGYDRYRANKRAVPEGCPANGKS